MPSSRRRLDLPEQRAFEILLTVGVPEPEKVEHIGIAEHQVRREPVLLAQRLEILFDELRGLLREGGALVEQAVDPGAQVPHAPALDTAHLGIEVPFEGVGEGEDLPEVAPSQLSRQRGDNLGIGERLRKLDHPAKALFAEPSAELLLQPLGQRPHDLRAILRPSLFEDLPPDTVTDPPVEDRQAGVDHPRGLLPGLEDEVAYLGQDRAGQGQPGRPGSAKGALGLHVLPV